MILLLGGCNNNSSNSETKVNKLENSKKQTVSMKMYVYSYDKRTLNAIDDFNYTSEVKIKPILLNDENDGKQYREKIVASILSGDGPDIILDSAYWFPALWKVAGNSAFLDLNETIQKDKEFKLANYRENVMDAGIIDGKRYFMPLGLDIPLLWTTDKLLQQSGIQINGNKFTWNDFEKYALQSTNNISKDSKKYFVGFDFNFADILKSSWSKWVDLRNKKSYFDSTEFINTLEMYKKIYPTICPNEELVQFPGLHFDMLENKSLLIVDGSSEASPYQLWSNNSIVNKRLNSKMEILSYPSIGIYEKISAQIDRFVAIGIYSRNKNEAFNFIKLLLSEKYQGVNTDDVYNTYAPVNKLAYESMIKEYTSETSKNKTVMWKQQDYMSVPIPKELISKTDTYINSMNFEFMDVNIVDIVDIEVKAYISGKQDAKQTAKSINGKVTLYLNE